MNPLISPEELHTQLSGQDPPIVIDVREEEAFRAGHIAGARRILIDDLVELLAQLPKDRSVVTY